MVTYRHALTPPEIAILELLDANPKDKTLGSNEVEMYIMFAERNGFRLVSKRSDSITSSLLLFRKVRQDFRDVVVIEVKNQKFEEWVDRVKEIMAENKETEGKANSVWLVANDSDINGIVGLANCLRLESGGQHIRCLFDANSRLPQPVDFNRSPYSELRQLDLTVNVLRDGKWGTLRHICLPKEHESVDTEHAYLNVVTRGDMSSLKWFDAHHKYFPDLTENERNPKETLCDVYYSALNFKVLLLLIKVRSHSDLYRNSS